MRSRTTRPGSARTPDSGRDGEAGALRLLGLARRAGCAVLGVDRSRRALRRGEAFLLLKAADASPVQLRKVEGPAERTETETRVLGDRDSLGEAVGGPPLSAVVITDEGFAEQLLGRLAAPGTGEGGDG